MDRVCAGEERVRCIRSPNPPGFGFAVRAGLDAHTGTPWLRGRPISWTNRRSGESELSLQEQRSRYLFIVLIVFLEHHLSRGDYRRRPAGR